MIKKILLKWFAMLQSWISALVKWLLGMRISTISPGQGWPGTIITITGSGFSENRDENNVLINGVKAIVVEASENRLLIVAGEATNSGTITVIIGGKTATSAGNFTVLPYPSPDNISANGAPRFFHGPQNGTPITNVKNQGVLVLLTFPTDQDPGNVTNRNILRNELISRFDSARQYWEDASYGSTTWSMNYSEWLALPQNRRFYFWQQEDIDDARKILFNQTGRALTFDGARIFRGASTGWIPVDHPNPLSYSFNPGTSTAGSSTMALKLDGNRLYAGTASGIIFAYNVTNFATPVLLGSITLPNSFITSIEVSGSHLLVAAREGGIHWIDVSNPAAMIQIVNIGTGDNWAMAAKVSGSRGYVGAGKKLIVIDLSVPMPVAMSTTALGNWATDLDISGNICSVATDGDGVSIFEITAGGVLNRSAFRNVLRIRGIKMSGNFAFLAANAAGFVVIDISNMSAPTQVAQLKTTKPCFNISIKNNEAILALGAEDMLSVTITNPVTPTKNGSEMPSSWDPDIDGLQTNLTIVQNLQAQVKDSNPLFVHAIRAYLSIPGNSIDLFEGIIVVVNGPFLRGQSWLADDFTFNGEKIKFNHTKGVIYFSFSAEITRIAHEIGHWLGMWDIYTEWFADGTYLEGNAAKWCLSGMDGDRPLFCAHQIHEKMRFYNSITPNINVAERAWSPTATLNENFDIVAHDLAQDGDPNPNRIHVLKLKVADGLFYYVEVRQVPIGHSFDHDIPVPIGEPGLVVVTKVTEKASISNTFERPIMLFGELKLGEKVVDAARSLTITVDSKVQDRPLVYRVNVQWNQPIPGDPNGKFDMTITPWNTDTWETIDIWIDSPRNNPASGPEYEFFEGTDKTKPRLNGDRPWVHHKNKIYARIRNSGPIAVSDVYVTCSTSSPPGLGDNGQWSTLSTKKIATLPGNGETIIDFDWTPSADKHTCIKVSILPQIGEIQTENNFAQENVGVFDSGAASSCQPVVLETAVRSPFSVWRKVDLIVRGLPLGWHAVVDKSWVWLEGHGNKPASAVIWTDYNVNAGKDQRYGQIAYARIEGWTSFDHRYLPIGGFLAAVKAVKKVKPDFNVEVNGQTILIGGHLTPSLPDVPITIEVLDEKGSAWLFYTVTNASGNFNFNTTSQRFQFEKGKYIVKVFVTAGGNAAETEAHPRKFEIH